MSWPESRDHSRLVARQITVTGRVQGVGFRPFVWRIAKKNQLSGWVRNGGSQVDIHVEGPERGVASFMTALVAEAPPLSRPQLIRSRVIDAQGLPTFSIVASAAGQATTSQLPPDLFCCDDCLREMRTPSERRYRYPFTNCTQCGPRYTIIATLPYDRPHTTMAGFVMCDDCRVEYLNPLDRRFHAQPLACPACGPRLSFHHGDVRLQDNERALDAAIDCLRGGGIVAVKGVGGYHLMCDPANDRSVAALRQRKHRPAKPLAVMFPQVGADGLQAVRACVTLDDSAAAACLDPERPIVLARRTSACSLSTLLAPGLAELGVFLPYSPLHHLLLDAFEGPLVATSGNVSGEPVITDNDESERRLAQVADAFLHHNRPILRPADDSVVRVIAGEPRRLRVGRGLAPLELDLAVPAAAPLIALGGHMKCTVALASQKRAIVSPHLGDLGSMRSLDGLEDTVHDLEALYDAPAWQFVCDANPDYASTRWATAQDCPVSFVQHHVAHASALAGEYPGIERWLVFVWDGTGLGAAGSQWGGEAFAGRPGAWQRVASLRRFHLLGGDRAAREPWRSAAALMWETSRNFNLPGVDGSFARQAWRKRLGCHTSSSAGRIFDAAAAMILGVHETTFEGQGPMMLESVAGDKGEPVSLPLAVDDEAILRADWEPLLAMLCDERTPAPVRSAIFHASMARLLADQVSELASRIDFQVVGLTGGVFQNRRLCEEIVDLLDSRAIPIYQHRLVPSGDGGLSFGQLVEFIHAKRQPSPDARD
jgi:hydrogenase maturation protein HypF